jgi:hypothetical protein
MKLRYVIRRNKRPFTVTTLGFRKLKSCYVKTHFVKQITEDFSLISLLLAQFYTILSIFRLTAEKLAFIQKNTLNMHVSAG